MKNNIMPIILAIFMSAVLLGTGAASAIIGTFSDAMGWLGGIAGFILVLSLIFAGFSK